MKERKPDESRAHDGTGAPAELSELEAAAAFSTPLRRLVSIKPATLLAGSVLAFFAGAETYTLLRLDLLYIVAECASLFGAMVATGMATKQLIRYFRDQERERDHSWLLLLFLILVGGLWSAGLAFWMTLTNAAD